ncbi:unnamed protein product [Blepharisma stoltei]|uniref:Ammonium transporter AmtB-like domain-containing protein n=1 Tax=Blepharisma stoltei TaxID=1481888 RepID=A0AAU9KA01_9CILI|nr:unnamed protein product [Blepharisma stoltei]
MESETPSKKRFLCPIYLIFLEAAIIILYGLFTSFSSFSEPINPSLTPSSDSENHFILLYPLYQDISIMIFVGIGFLMSFLRFHSWSSVGFNFILGALSLQLYILFNGLWVRVITNSSWDIPINLDISLFINALFGTAAVLISLGGVIGKLNLFQLVCMATIEICIYALNEAIVFNKIHITDVGGSIVVHIFGGYFGLTVSLLVSSNNCKNHPKLVASYKSNLFSMIGTLFLWVYWPSFNAAPALNINDVHRATLNTILSLTGSCIATFIFSTLFKNGKLCMDDILNATLAGGVIIGTSADIIVYPFSSLIIGCWAGFLTTFGFRVLSPLLQRKSILYDTCGIHNLHALPGVFGGVFSAIFIAGLTKSSLGYRVEDRFSGRSASEQAVLQIIGCGISLGFAVISGIFTGILLKLPCFEKINSLFDDKEFWVIENDPDDYLAVGHAHRRTESTDGKLVNHNLSN